MKATTLLLIPILCLLFWKSFAPAYVPFSNDGPYGSVVTKQADPRACWAYGWQDLNWIGSRFETPGPSVSMGARLLLFMGPSMWVLIAVAILIVSLPLQFFMGRISSLTGVRQWMMSQYCAAGLLWISLLIACVIRQVFACYTDPSPLLGLGGLLFMWGMFMVMCKPEEA